jgi:hypothetical protein
MEAEVSALMSAADEAIWNSAGLFSTSDELSKHTNLSLSHSVPKPPSSTSAPPASVLTPQTPSSSTLPTTSISPVLTPLKHFQNPQHSVVDTLSHLDCRHTTLAWAITTTLFPPAFGRGLLQGSRSVQACPTLHEHFYYWSCS